jgi:hypothetical protein
MARRSRMDYRRKTIRRNNRNSPPDKPMLQPGAYTRFDISSATPKFNWAKVFIQTDLKDVCHLCSKITLSTKDVDLLRNELFGFTYQNSY